MRPYQTKYDRDLLNRFYLWATRDVKGQLKYETFKAFHVGKRLATFKRLQPKYNPTPQQLWEQLFHGK